MSEVQYIDVIELSKMQVLLREDGIVHIKLNEGEELDTSEFQELVEHITRLTKGKPGLMLFEAEISTSSTPEVRNYASHENANFVSIADAIVVKTMAQKLQANFYIQFNRPSRPTKVFTSVDKAVRWLHQVEVELLK